MAKEIRVYLAAPLFTQGEWLWNSKLAGVLRDLGINVTLPQASAEPMLKGKREFDPARLFSENLKEIDNSDVVLAVLDQADPDSGTCWECGYAYKAGRPVIGLRTDFRPAGDDPTRPVNLMLGQSCKGFVVLEPANIDDLSALAKRVAEVIRSVAEQQ